MQQTAYAIGLLFAFTLPCLGQQSKCLMQPLFSTMVFPDSGYTNLDEEFQPGACDSIPDSAWTKLSGEHFNLYVFADLHSGSGRYWTVTYGISATQDSVPDRGFCLQTSTVGWRTFGGRTIQNFKRLPLPWMADEDNDGDAEIIIWGSFPLHHGDVTNAESGIVAWVYQVDTNGICGIDWTLSRKIAREIAVSYRTPAKSGDRFLQDRRVEAAEALEWFASEKCRVRP